MSMDVAEIAGRFVASLFFACLAVLVLQVFWRVLRAGPAAIRERRLKTMSRQEDRL